MNENSNSKNRIPTIGIAASVDGLQALKEFVSGIDAKSGFCYVVVQNLAAGRSAIDDRTLQECCDVPVKIIEAGDRLTGNVVYVNPLGKQVKVYSGECVLEDSASRPMVRTSIDQFFISLARQLGGDACAVVLSGAETNGAKGIQEIKKSGGVVAVQEGRTLSSGMPDSVIANGLTDFVLPPARIAGALLEHREFREKGLCPAILSGDEDESIKIALPQIVRVLADAGHCDFSGYKPGTLTRRIIRRMGLARATSVEAYVSVLRDSADERKSLAQDFLIGVTRFYRDPDSYAILNEEVIPALLQRPQETLRVWVPGCSTGEEVYSLAILLRKLTDKNESYKPFQIFGTDIDIEALKVGRDGVYSEDALAAVAPEDVTRFFDVESQGHFRVKPMIREICLFAPHNLLSDPPFSRIDLISCKNLLIYLNEKAQAMVMPNFHYALNPSGYLALGPSETTAFGDELFKSVDRRRRIFKRDDNASAQFTALRSSRLPLRDRYPNLGVVPNLLNVRNVSESLESEIERQFVQNHAGPFLAVDKDDGIIYLSAAMSEFVQTGRGVIKRSIDHMLIPDLHLPIKNTVAEARESRTRTLLETIVLPGDQTPRVIDIVATPTSVPEDTVIVEIHSVRVLNASSEVVDVQLSARETKLAERRLQMLEGNYRASEQKLRSANEELLSMNEELQSSNEELDTSREELQSINEELETINSELTTTNADLAQSLSNMHNLLESTQLAVLFLDKDQRVRLFTPKTEELFSIRDRDVGRPISELRNQIEYPNMLDDVNKVMTTLVPMSREATLNDSDSFFEVRLRPYQTVNGEIDGCVITFVDVSDSRRTEEQARTQSEVIARQFAELEMIYAEAPIGLVSLDTEFRFLRVNETFSQLTGLLPEQLKGKEMQQLLPRLFEKNNNLLEAVLETGCSQLNNRIDTNLFGIKDGHERNFVTHFYPLKTRDKIIGIGACFVEITKEVGLKAQLERAAKRVAVDQAVIYRMFDKTPVSITMYSGPEHRLVYSNEFNDELFRDRELLGRPILEALPDIASTGIVEQFDSVYHSAESFHVPKYKSFMHPEHDPKFYSYMLQPWYEADDVVGGVMSVAFDVTELHSVNEKNKMLMHEMSHRVKNLLSTVQAIAYFTSQNSGSVESFNDSFFDRLDAMARANEHLFTFDEQNRSLTEIFAIEFERIGSKLAQRVTISGDDVQLTRQHVPAISLVIHELITNALKYGALTGPDGSIVLASQFTAESNELLISWIEQNEDAIKKPQRRGFGSSLLLEMVKQKLNGEASLEFLDKGVEFTLRFRLDGENNVKR